MSGAWRWSYHLLRMTQSLHRLGRRHNTFEEVVTKVGTVIYTLSKPSGLKSNLQTFVVHKPYYCESSSQVSLAFLFCCPAWQTEELLLWLSGDFLVVGLTKTPPFLFAAGVVILVVLWRCTLSWKVSLTRTCSRWLWIRIIATICSLRTTGL